MKKILLSIASVAFLFIACSRKVPIPAAFWPLEDGNQWTTSENYTWNVVGVSTGSSVSKTTYTVDPFVESAEGKLLWPVLASTDTSGQGVGLILSTTYYYVTEDSVYLYSDTLDKPPKAVEPNNLAVGMTWDGNLALPIQIPDLVGFSTTFPAHFEIVSDTSIAVLNGTFNALVIKIDLQTSSGTIDSAATQWRAKDIGIVKMSTDFTTKYSIGIATFDVKITGTSELESRNF
jgi:hypothetical protein